MSSHREPPFGLFLIPHGAHLAPAWPVGRVVEEADGDLGHWGGNARTGEAGYVTGEREVKVGGSVRGSRLFVCEAVPLVASPRLSGRNMIGSADTYRTTRCGSLPGIALRPAQGSLTPFRRGSSPTWPQAMRGPRALPGREIPLARYQRQHGDGFRELGAHGGSLMMQYPTPDLVQRTFSFSRIWHPFHQLLDVIPAISAGKLRADPHAYAQLCSCFVRHGYATSDLWTWP
jgi:hypothetical protein